MMACLHEPSALILILLSNFVALFNSRDSLTDPRLVSCSAGALRLIPPSEAIR